MARPIAPTPTLKGKDALKFLADLEANRGKKVDKEVIQRIKANAKAFRDIMVTSKELQNDGSRVNPDKS